MCHSHLPFICRCLSHHSIHSAHSTAFRVQPLYRHFSSLICSRKKSRGSTVPCSLQPCRLSLLEAEDSAPEEYETRPRPFWRCYHPRSSYGKPHYPPRAQV